MSAKHSLETLILAVGTMLATTFGAAAAQTSMAQKDDQTSHHATFSPAVLTEKEEKRKVKPSTPTKAGQKKAAAALVHAPAPRTIGQVQNKSLARPYPRTHVKHA